MLLTEQPRFSQPVALYARRNGRYDRPIMGAMVDIRMEDTGLSQLAQANRIPNVIAQLPDISEANQVGQYLVFNFGWLDGIETKAKAEQLLATGKYLQLPATPQDEYWSYTKSPWWEYAEVMDEHDGIIKAAKVPRGGEATAEECDERLDEFEENQGKLKVLAPTTLEKMLAGAVRESYLKKLRRI